MFKHVTILFLATLAACSPQPPHQNDTDQYIEKPGNNSDQPRIVYPRLATLPASREGDSAALQGTLSIKGSCIYAKASTNGLHLIASMNPDVYWDDRQQSLVLSGGKLVKPGDPIMLGGSTYTGPQGQLNWTTAPDKTCDLTNIWIASSITLN
jgi:hypothetical protein